MPCARCETLPFSPADRGSLVVTAPVPELIRKVVEFVDRQELPHQVEERAVILPDASLLEVLCRMRDARFFNALERRDILAVLLHDGEALSVDTITRTRTLERWLGLLEARALLEILAARRFVAWFQPIVAADSGEVIGYESLLRGRKPDGSLMFPGEIFGAAATNDLLFQVDRQARETALRCASEQGIRGQIFVNFVPTAIYDPAHCLQNTLAVARRLGIAPGQIVFEVIETERVEDMRHLQHILDFYRASGFRIALDDVGSGYASLSLLAMLRPDIIKVDMEIVRGIHQDSDRQAIFRALVGIARDLGIQVLAEGVETREEYDYVVAQGADLLQGYLFARPAQVPPAIQPVPPRPAPGHT